MKDKIGSFSPDLGLEYIARYDDQPVNLPAQREAQLTGEQVRQRVDELFRGESLEQSMRNFVSPRLSNPATLVPARFEALVQESAKQFNTVQGGKDDPALQRAGELLDHELQLRALLTHYRGLLMQV
ncbi:MAG: hypothetical protein V2J55_08280 [Candidatus Competibacteraceae bacterium]|jgi:hypothetical protein|nr:hypothetical protein [Candidatus Competibacteraceae bacterium]